MRSSMAQALRRNTENSKGSEDSPADSEAGPNRPNQQCPRPGRRAHRTALPSAL